MRIQLLCAITCLLAVAPFATNAITVNQTYFCFEIELQNGKNGETTIKCRNALFDGQTINLSDMPKNDDGRRAIYFFVHVTGKKGELLSVPVMRRGPGYRGSQDPTIVLKDTQKAKYPFLSVMKQRIESFGIKGWLGLIDKFGISVSAGGLKADVRIRPIALDAGSNDYVLFWPRYVIYPGELYGIALSENNVILQPGKKNGLKRLIVSE